jgi:hypothetical protein
MMMTTKLHKGQISAIKVSWSTAEHKNQKGTKEFKLVLQFMSGETFSLLSEHETEITDKCGKLVDISIFFVASVFNFLKFFML